MGGGRREGKGSWVTEKDIHIDGGGTVGEDWGSGRSEPKAGEQNREDGR